jgi:hypothetical protein
MINNPIRDRVRILLPLYTDAEIARQVGRSRERIRQIRNIEDIPCPVQKRHLCTLVTNEEKVSNVLKMNSTTSAKEICKKLKLNRGVLYKIRRELEIEGPYIKDKQPHILILIQELKRLFSEGKNMKEAAFLLNRDQKQLYMFCREHAIPWNKMVNRYHKNPGCTNCGEHKNHYAKGLCRNCYSKRFIKRRSQ